MTRELRIWRFIRIGFRPEQAEALVGAGYDVMFVSAAAVLGGAS